MAIPHSVPNDVRDVLYPLQLDVNQAVTHWTHYADALSAAYDLAYQDQERVFKGVKNYQEKKRESDRAFLALSLSMLCVGIGGPLAGVLAKKVLESERVREAVIPPIEHLLWEEAGKLIPDATADSDAFAPGGVDPTLYMAKLHEAVSGPSAQLADFLVRLEKRAESGLTAQSARQIAERVREISYIKEAPRTDIQSDDTNVRRSVSLALWIGWAYARDAKYWKKAADVPDSDAWDEQFDWEPVRQTLSWWVPSALITVHGEIPHATGIFGALPRHPRPPAATGLNMWGFLKWVASPASHTMLFAGLPKHAKGLEMVEDQMAHMQLTPTGWVWKRPVSEKLEKAMWEAAVRRHGGLMPPLL
jgi:hypothetical protein